MAPLDQVDHFINTVYSDPRFRPPRPESTPVAPGGPSTPQAPSTGIRMQHRHRVWQHRLNAAPRGRCKQGMFPLLLCCSLQSRCGLRTLGVRLSPCCSRAHLWQPIADRLLKACENLVALKASLEHVVGSADARQHGPPSVGPRDLTVAAASDSGGSLPSWPRIMLRFASNRVTGGSLAFCGFLDGFFGFSRPPTPLLDFFFILIAPDASPVSSSPLQLC